MWTYETHPAGIPVKCSTNLDDFTGEKWPRLMACRPQVGDSVAAASGKTLKVVRIIHGERAVKGSDGQNTGAYEPYVEVELWK